MSGFLYFKPGESAVTKESVKAWGLGYAFSERVAGVRCQGRTPNGAGGIVFADKTRMGESEIRMDMPKQTWGKIPKSDLWVGFWNDAKPTPPDLARSQQLPGYDVLMADDVRWSVPVVRRFDVSKAELVSALPCYMECNDDGVWGPGRVMEAHSHLWELLTPFADDIISRMNTPDAESTDFTDSQIYDVVTTLLQANYVVGPGELSVMKAIPLEAGWNRVILFACDFPTFWAWNEDQKKSSQPLASDAQNLTAGDAA